MSKQANVSVFVILLVMVLGTYVGNLMQNSSLDLTTKILLIIYSFAVMFLGLLFEFLRSQEEEKRWQEKIRL